jgi:hypothetical protein
MRKGHGAVGVLVLTLTLAAATATAMAGTTEPAAGAPEGTTASTTTSSATPSTATTSSAVPTTAAPTTSAGTSTTLPPTSSRPPGPAVTAAQTECLPNYPTVCVPLGPDLDCDDIDATDFPVNGSDPFRLDDDGDGAACERPAADPPATNGPAAAPPPTAAPGPPPSVAGAAQVPGGSPNSTRLAATGVSTDRSLVAVALLLSGLALVAAAGVVGDPTRGRRGGFTVVSIDRNGTTFVNHVTASGR